MTNLIRPLRDRLGHTHEVYLLKGISTQGRDGHLTCNHHNRRGIKHGIGNTRQGISHSGTTGHQGHTDLARDAGIALCGMGSALFVTHQNMVETFLLTSCIVEERIINGHDAAAWVSEDGLHALGLQRPHQRLRSCNSISHSHLYLLARISRIFTAFYSIHRLKQC